MRVLACGVRPYEQDGLQRAFRDCSVPVTLHCVEWSLDGDTCGVAGDTEAVLTTGDSVLDAHVLEQLSKGGTRLVSQRSTGHANIDLEAARRLGLWVSRVHRYSPHSVAEFAWALVHTVNRHLPRALSRTREFDFRLDGLQGRELHGRTLGVVGTGRIGSVFARIGHGHGMRMLGWDLRSDPELVALGMDYVPLDELLRRSDVVSLHVPLTRQTHHLLDAAALALLPDRAVLVNTGRGGLVDTRALVAALRAGRLAGVGLDVYEEEERLFFRDLSVTGIGDDVLARLMTFPNVIVTSRQAFFTEEAMANVRNATVANVVDYSSGRVTENTLVHVTG